MQLVVREMGGGGGGGGGRQSQPYLFSFLLGVRSRESSWIGKGCSCVSVGADVSRCTCL